MAARRLGPVPPTKHESRCALWQQLEPLDVRRPDDAEVPAVKGCDLSFPKPLGQGDGRGVDRAEGHLAVGPYQLRDSQPIACGHRLSDEESGRDVTNEASLGFGAEARSDEIGNLGNDEDRKKQWTRVGFEQLSAGCVVAVIGIEGRIERPGINDQPDCRSSLRRSSSIRSDTSCSPLRQALPPANRRRDPPPRWRWIASRVSSETVRPLRAASWRSRASSSSGSLTVVRLMV